jgi:hypothetical protein
LFKYLSAHPQCSPSIRKEIRFFTEFYTKSVDWYRSHFSIISDDGHHALPFEATPDYLFDPRVPKRASELLPDAKIIVLLRNPVERAYSQYRHNLRKGTEWLPFEEALAQEADRIGPALEKLRACPEAPASKSLLRYSYVERGRYASQLLRWKAFVDDDRLLVIKSENLFRDPRAVFLEVQKFLGLRVWSPKAFRNYSFEGSRPIPKKIPPGCRDWLMERLAPEMELLSKVMRSEAFFTVEDSEFKS